MAIALDMYHFTWHLLHMKIKTGQFNMLLCVKLKELSALLEEGLTKLYSTDLQKKLAKQQNVTVKDDYIEMITSVLNQADKNFLSFKEIIPQLAAKYPESRKFIGKIMKAYFRDGECLVQKGKNTGFKPINSNTLQNYYSKANKHVYRVAN